MILLRGLVFSSSLLSTIFAARALQLNKPNVVPGQDVVITWISSEGDPTSMGLWASCDGAADFIIAPAVSVPEESYTIDEPNLINQFAKTPLSCNLQARKTDNISVLSTVTFTIAGDVATTSSLATSSQSSVIPGSATSTDATDTTSISTRTTSLLSTAISASTVDSSATATPQPSQTQSPTSHITSIASNTLFNSSTGLTETATSSYSAVLNTIIPSSASSNIPTQPSKRRTGPIIGAVVGVLLGLLILAALLFFLVRRRRQHRRTGRPLSVIRDAKAGSSAAPLFTDKEEAIEDPTTTISEFSVPTEARSQHQRIESSVHSINHSDDLRSTNLFDMSAKLEPLRHSGHLVNALPMPPTVSDGEDWNGLGINNRETAPSLPGSPMTDGRYSYASASVGRYNLPLPYSADQPIPRRSSSRLVNIDETDREQRRDAILEQMRKVLNGEQ